MSGKFIGPLKLLVIPG